MENMVFDTLNDIKIEPIEDEDVIIDDIIIKDKSKRFDENLALQCLFLKPKSNNTNLVIYILLINRG